MSRTLNEHDGIRSLLQVRSLAIVGASPTNAVARNVVRWNRALGSRVQVSPIHPTNSEFEGYAAVSSLGLLDSVPDVVAVALGTERARAAVDEAASVGVKTVVVYSDLRAAFAGPGELATWFDGIAAAGTRLVGPNCMGYLSPAERFACYSGDVNSLAASSGDVGIISQSGAVVIALLAAAPRLQFSHVFSSGNESSIGLADYLEFLADDSSTTCIGLFIESIRDPQRFDAAAASALARGKPIVALCVGKSSRGRENVATHSGALAPEHRVLSAYLRDRGVIEVDSFHEMTETLVALRSTRRPRSAKAGMVHLSGGEASLQLDIAADGPLSFPRLSSRTRAAMADDAPWLSEADNPLDAWGPPSFSENYRRCLAALAADDGVDFVIANQAIASHLCDGGPAVGADVAHAVAEFTRYSPKPVVVLSNAALGIDGGIQATLAEVGVALLSGDVPGIRAIEHCVRYYERLQADEWPVHSVAEPALDDIDPAQPQHVLALSEAASSDVLASAGLRRPRSEVVRFAPDAVAAANEIGFPVVLKATGATLTHKTDLGAVVVGIRDEASLLMAFDDISARVDGHDDVEYLVVEQVTRHREVLLGAHHDPVFGLVMVIGMGGVMAELLADTVLAFPPLSVARARRLVDELRCRAWFGPWRHLGPADLGALAEFIATFSEWLDLKRHVIESADLNPVAVLEEGRGCLFLDALLVERGPMREEELKSV